MCTRLFNALMNLNKPSIFVKNLARYLFGKEVLISSTVTGKESNRTKTKNIDSNLTPLDASLLATLRG